MAVRIQFRRGTAAEWVSANPTLAAGELGYETDTAQIKIGTGALAWNSLPYAAVSASYVDDAIANVVGLAPETLDTLNELAAAMGDNPSFISDIEDDIDSARAYATGYTDNAIANLIASAPAALDTLNELADALGSDANFSTTVSTALSQRLQFVADNVANYEANNPIIDENILAIEVDSGNVKIGDGVNAWNALVYVNQVFLSGMLNTHASDTTSIHGIANTAELVTTTMLSEELEDYTTSADIANGYVSAVEIENYALLTDLEPYATNANLDLKAPLANPTFTGTVSLPASIEINNISIGNTTATEISYLANVSSDIQTQLDAKASLNSPSFTGTVELPTTTSIGNITSAELEHLDGVTSAIQSQIDGKLGLSTAATTYAPLVDATLTGNVALPATTSIGDVSATEISYVNGVTSAIQTQLDTKAPLESPTFTGTVSGLTAAMVGLADVDNTSDADKPVSTATQSALDAKAALAGATFTGDVETVDLTVTGNLIVQGTTTTISASDLSVKDNMIYLNQAGVSTLTNAVGDGTNVVYTTAEAHGYSVGDDVVITGTTPSSFNIASPGSDILAVTSNTFTVASTVTDTYTSGGTARGRVHSNPDLGWAAGRYDTVNGVGYAHAGLFRDASDGVFKFFDGYEPEPDESVFIDTSDNTFALADIAVADVTAANVTADAITFADGTTQNSAGVPSLTEFVEKTSSYTLDILDHKDNVVEMNSSSAVTFTVPTNASLAWPIGASVDILQTGTGQVTIAAAGGVTLNFTPGNKLRTRWSSCTIMKRGTDSWILYGDLTA